MPNAAYMYMYIPVYVCIVSAAVYCVQKFHSAVVVCQVLVACWYGMGRQLEGILAYMKTMSWKLLLRSWCVLQCMCVS